MSQLELALKKARAMEAAAGGDAPGIDPKTNVSSWAFKSAWEFDDSEPHSSHPPDDDSPPHLEVRDKVRRPATHATSAAEKPARVPAARFRDFSVEIREKLVVGEQALPELREQFRKVAATL